MSADYYCAADIALATGASKKTVHRTAVREGWPTRRVGNRDEYMVPANIAAIIIAAPREQVKLHAPVVRFCDLAHSDAARAKVLWREEAVQLVTDNLVHGKERALQLVCAHMKAKRPLFACGARSLRDWCDAYQAHGIDGLVEQKRGKVGRKAFAADLTEEQILQGRANAIEHGIKGRTNIAAAFRTLAGNPTLNGPARFWAHGARESKSSVPPSVRAAFSSPELATKLIQIGPKAAKLDGPYTECTYENVPAGHTFTADDMTANCYVWCEWPNEQGFLLIRPQILAVADVGSQAWLNIRAIIRPKGQYNRDDVWGVIGDTLDEYGIFKQAVLEGGSWQSELVIGQKTGLDDNARFGGLRSLGMKVIHTRTPKGKIIETMFNGLQHAADNVPGFCGRMEMKDCPEEVKKQKYLVEAGHAHPRQFFLHLSEYTEHLKQVMKTLNFTRRDGKACRGLAPADKWAEDAPSFEVMPDAAKWLYRAAFRVVEVTRNGVRIGVGSGRNEIHYGYSKPEALEPLRGRRVIVFWNDSNPDADVLVYSIRDGKQDKFICKAALIPDLPRFGATEEQAADEMKRKKLHMQVARTHAASLAPYLQRSIKTLERPTIDTEVGKRIVAAHVEHGKQVQAKKHVRRYQGSAEDLLDAAGMASSQDFPERVQTPSGASGANRISTNEGGAVVAAEISDTDLSADGLLD